MGDAGLRKQLLIERVQSNRDLLTLEVDAVRSKFSTARNLARTGLSLLQPLGGAAATAAGAAGAAGVRKAGLGGAAGLAALVPVAIAVARLVITWNEGKKSRAAAEPTSEGVAEDAAPETAADAGDTT
jgi:hypothetical protein